MVGRLQCVNYQIVHCESIPSNNKIHQVTLQQLAQLDIRHCKLAFAIPGCWAILHSLGAQCATRAWNICHVFKGASSCTKSVLHTS